MTATSVCIAIKVRYLYSSEKHKFTKYFSKIVYFYKIHSAQMKVDLWRNRPEFLHLALLRKGIVTLQKFMHVIFCLLCVLGS